jgi:hypothetical protein
MALNRCDKKSTLRRRNGKPKTPLTLCPACPENPEEAQKPGKTVLYWISRPAQEAFIDASQKPRPGNWHSSCVDRVVASAP